MNKISAFIGGMGAGMLYQKYNKDIMKLMKKAKKTVNDTK